MTDCTNCATGKGCATLPDLDVTSETGSAGNSGITSFVCEHDLGSNKTLGTFRAFCDASGPWKTQEVTVKTRVQWDDSYTTIVHAGTCTANAWFSFSLEEVAARYVEITFACPSGCDGTQAREYELTGTPQSLPFPGPKRFRIVGETQPNGSMR